MSKVYTRQNPYLIDKTIAEIQNYIADKLQYENIFGRCERTVKEVNGRKIFIPTFYKGANEYYPLLPDSDLNNFVFFNCDEPQRVDLTRGNPLQISTTVNIILWFDIRTLENADERNTEKIKYNFLDALKNIVLTAGRISVNKIYTLAENIYRGFSLDEVQNQFLMSPFGGFRFECDLQIKYC